MPGGRLQAASDATRTEAVALVEAKVLSGRENDTGRTVSGVPLWKAHLGTIKANLGGSSD